MKVIPLQKQPAETRCARSLHIAVIDHGFANIGSLSNALEYLGFQPIILSCKTDYNPKNIDGFILPGVGSFQPAIKSLRDRRLDDVVFDLLEKGVRGMGICLGMQMLAQCSEEDNFSEKGLSIFPGKITKIPSKLLPIPNISWVDTHTNPNFSFKDELLKTSLAGTFYFVHSFSYEESSNDNSIAAIYRYGDNDITAAIYKDNILGLQFHPEKSQSNGLRILANYFS